ncbi:MAG: polysulfide reductase NrfD [Coriobacteriales bacterium]|jgi:formate-dependent nitrite reductase membrane component NrfD|nr:polysulfide reductase NrfD [Coriobacteriales bacterium]
MFSQSAIWYIFFAGAGSGLAFVVFVIDSFLRRFRPWFFTQYRPFVAPGLFLGIALTVLGALFLFFDLGRPDRILAFVLHPSPNALTIGAWSVLAFTVCAALQLQVRLRFAAAVPTALHIALRWATAASAASVMLYTGLFIQSLSSLHFLASPLLPLLFMLSSLSCGVALLLLLGFLHQPRGIPLRPFVRLTKAHLPLLVLELAVLIGYLVLMAGGTQAASAGVARLLSGDCSLAFWGGVVAVGLALPLGLELVLRGRATWNSTAAYALACMAGGLALRFCFLTVGAHPSMGLGLVVA